MKKKKETKRPELSIETFMEAVKGIHDFAGNVQGWADEVVEIALKGEDPTQSQAWRELDRTGLFKDWHKGFLIKTAEMHRDKNKVSEQLRVGRAARGVANATAKTVYEGGTIEHAREAIAKWQDRLILDMRQMIMLNVCISDRVLEMTSKFTNPAKLSQLPEYEKIYRREVKKEIGLLERSVKNFKAGVLQGVDEEWKPDYANSQETFNSKVMARNMTVAWYSLLNALLKDGYKLPEPLAEFYFCAAMIDIVSINTVWRKEELHKLDPCFDKCFKWSIFDVVKDPQLRLKRLLYLFSEAGCKDHSLPLYPESMPYSYMDKNPQTKAACNIILQQVNDIERIVPCLMPEMMKQHNMMKEDLEDWLYDNDLKLNMKNADGWKRESDLSLEGQAAIKAVADYNASKQKAEEEGRDFDAVGTWTKLTEDAEKEWVSREKTSRESTQRWFDGLRRLHEDWTEEQIKREMEADQDSIAAVITEPRMEILKERLQRVRPKEVQKAFKPKKTRAKTTAKKDIA